MPCPFGFTAEDGEAEDELSEVGDEDEAAEGGEDGEAVEVTEGEIAVEGTEAGVKKKKEAKPKAPAATEDAPAEKEGGKKERRKDRKKADLPDKDRFNMDKDPISWFYQNQIKSEEDFDKKRDQLREAAKKRLDDIMSKKGKGIEWPSDSEFDDLSIHSSELSDLDSDCDSLASLASVANSWIVEARYKTPAESWLKTVAWVFMIALVHSLFTAFVATVHMRKVQGIAVNTWWGSATATVIGASMALDGLLLVAANYRSRRMLLGAQLGFLAAYAASVVLITLNWFLPPTVDAKLKDGACSRYSSNDRGSKLCKMLPSIEREIAEDTGNLLFGLSLLVGGSILLVGLGIWYVMELGYVEKKAFKHKRRHKRRKHRIPWDKIKIVGPVTQCGGTGSGKPANGKAAGKCPVGFGGGAAPAGGACPFSGAAAATEAGSKKDN